MLPLTKAIILELTAILNSIGNSGGTTLVKIMTISKYNLKAGLLCLIPSK